MRQAGVLLVLALLAVAMAAPSATAQAPGFGEFHTDTSFAYIAVGDSRYSSSGEPVPIRADIHFKAGGGVDSARRVMFAFNVDQKRWLDIRFTSITYADGSPVPVEDDRRDSTDQPKVFVNPANASLAGRHVIMKGIATPGNNGRLHVGAMTMAFSSDWQKLHTADGIPMEVYGFAEMRVYGMDAGFFAPPFTGRGNIVPASAAAAVFGVTLMVAGYVAWRQGAIPAHLLRGNG